MLYNGRQSVRCQGGFYSTLIAATHLDKNWHIFLFMNLNIFNKNINFSSNKTVIKRIFCFYFID